MCSTTYRPTGSINTLQMAPGSSTDGAATESCHEMGYTIRSYNVCWRIRIRRFSDISPRSIRHVKDLLTDVRMESVRPDKHSPCHSEYKRLSDECPVTKMGKIEICFCER